MRLRFVVFVAFVALSLPAFAQPTVPKPLTHAVYDGWKRIAGESVSADGSRILWTVEPQEGDAVLMLLSRATGRRDSVLRGTGGKFTDDGRYAACLVKPFFAEVRKAKIAKKKGDDLPKDSLAIVALDSGTVTRIPRVKSFLLPEKGSGWIAYHCEKAMPDSAHTKRPAADRDASDGEPAAKKEKGTTLAVRELATGWEVRYPFVSDYIFTKTGSRLLFTSTGNDSTAAAGVFVFDTGTRTIDTLVLGKGSYTQIAWDDSGKQAAFLADRDTTKTRQRSFTLYYWTPGADSAHGVADSAATGMRRRWFISDNGNVWFSKDGLRLFFGTAPIPVPDDTTFNEETTASVDVWHWQDPYLQSQQLKNLEAEKKRTYLAVLHLASGKIVQLGDPELPVVTPGSEGNADLALGTSNLPYRRQESWGGAPLYDASLVDLQTGNRTPVLHGVRATISLSPEAHYLYWFDAGQRHWYTLGTHSLRTTRASSRIPAPLMDEENDLPDLPGAYGDAGWTAGDNRFLLYDRFDLWSVDPEGTAPPANLTAGSGRAGRIRYRALRLDPDERAWAPDATVLLTAFDERDKSAGFSTIRLGASGTPERLLLAPSSFSRPAKARRDSTFILTRSSFSDCPDLYVGTPRLDRLTRLTDINPQQREYLWGTAELIRWKMKDGTPLEGLLYRPGGFEKGKRYPLIVYYYERNADYLHRYWPPSPSRSTVSPSFYTSRGYAFFIPDIRYRRGHPGMSALDAIVSGTRKVLSLGFVDSTRMGLQGQSWGGYQTAFLITRTGMFRAAMAGAPVSNMTSAYDGIRLESGVIRQFQYEKSQSRIGATLWERPDLYLENSPLFRADRVTTPLLIMHNDNDGAVPWQQGMEMFGALRRLDKPVWMLVYNKEEHNLMQRRNMKDLSIRMAQFFDHYLQGAPLPVWMRTGRPAIEKNTTMAIDTTATGGGTPGR